jgi:hypothetical protein
MLGIPLRYLLNHPLAIAELAANPLQTILTMQDVYVAEREQRRPQFPYEPEGEWERRLHETLGMPWPCELAAGFQSVWHKAIGELEKKGIRSGPESFGSWNDGDAALARAIWCLTRHLQAANVVETGVAHGVTSRVILEALEENGSGHLWSIDLPPLEKSWRKQVGAAVSAGSARRWTYIKGSSRLHLPKLLTRLRKIDLFIHDSLHSERNVRFEIDRAWAALKPGGALVVDDIDANWGFDSFRRSFAGYRSLIGEAEPLKPDPRRFNRKGLFGIILKQPQAVAAAA